MTNKSRLTESLIAAMQRITVAVFAAIMLLAVPVAGNAQETTSEVRGNITGPNGEAAAGVSVTITDMRTGRIRQGTTSSSGRVVIGGLAVGGPYTVSMKSTDYAEQRVTDVYLSLGETFEFRVTLGDAGIDEIVVTASAAQTVQVAVGPSSTFNFDDLQNLPSVNRDIRDIIRVDPRIYIDEPFAGGVQCVGANPRFNSLTVDGIRMNDNFGLNSSGFPTQRQPFPFDAIQNVSVELAPFDVQYGGFTACNINAVTRSGTNEFHGRAWFDYNDDSLSGDSLEGTPIGQGDFDEQRYGFSFGGPIIKDKLFFFAAYEKADTADIFDRCAGDQNCGRPVLGVSQAQLDRIANIARTLWNYDPGDPVANLPNEDEKYLIKVDWHINENHRASLTYNWNDGFNFSRADGDADEFEFSNHLYERGAELNAYSSQLFSNWTDNFSTELRIGYSELDNRQLTRGGTGFAEIRIETYADPDGDGIFSDTADVFLGGDDSRQSNKLFYDTSNFKLAATYQLGDHTISGGYEWEETDIFNLFLQHTVAEMRFDESRTDFNGNPVGCNSSRPDGCIDQFEAFSPDDIYYGNASPSLNPNDAAANFASAVNTLYIQDEYTFSNVDLTIVAGLRYDWWSSDDLPLENANFVARTGFSNRKNFDGLNLLQPRFGFNWDVSDTLGLRGGFGLYSGGNPNVWLGNNYQNDGFTQVQAREFNGGVQNLNIDPNSSLLTIALGVDGTGQPGYDAPQSIIQFVAAGGGNSSVNAIAPNFEPPQNWKMSLGSTYRFDLPGRWGEGYVLSGDVLLTRGDNSAIIIDDTLVQIGTAPDGRPIYFPTDKSIAGCEADPLSDPGGCDRLFTSDFILSNVIGDDTEQLSIAFSLSKDYDWGLDWTLGYAYTESDDVNPMTSSVAFSNYFNVSVVDYNNPGLATSNYEIPHRIILKVGYSKDFFGDNTTRFTLFGALNQGRPFSYTFRRQEMFIHGPFFNPSDSRSLLYMPSGPNDPNVVFDPGFDQAGFFAFAASRGITQFGGGIVPRNEFNSRQWTRFDLRISQEIPGFDSEHHAIAYIIFKNIGNLINDDWGILYEQSFPRNQDIVEASLVDTLGTPDDFSDDQYLFERFNPRDQARSSSASLWSIRIGFNYNF